MLPPVMKSNRAADRVDLAALKSYTCASLNLAPIRAFTVSGKNSSNRRAPDARLPLWSRPGFLIRRLHQIHHSLFFEECGSFGITPVQYGLMTALSVRGTLDQISLAAELGIDRTNVAQVLLRLEQRGLVKRQSDPSDRRARLATLTARGRKLTARMFKSMQRSQQRFIEPLGRKERKTFMAALVRLIEANNEYGRTILRTD
jgi:DNA-binding MarR family transcriptional regulator